MKDKSGRLRAVLGVLRRGTLVLLAVVAIAAAATLRVVWAGERELKKSTEALQSGDADGAIDHARAAALWYAPGAPHVRVAYQRLIAIAKEAEERRLWDTALYAYRAVLTASNGSRWLTTPHAADADEAAKAIARIEAKTSERPAAVASDPPEMLERDQLVELSQEVGPSALYRAVLVGAFLAILVGLGVFVRYGLDETGRMHWGRGAPALLVVGAGLVGYCVALYLA